MSVSIEDDPAGDPEGADGQARATLSGWLDDYGAGRCERTDLEEAFLSVCRANEDASWDALALLDQYQRLKKIDIELARDLKSKIAQAAVRAPKQPKRTIAPVLPSVTEKRDRVAPEPEKAGGHTNDIDKDVTVLRKEARPASPSPPKAPAAKLARVQPSKPIQPVIDPEIEDKEIDDEEDDIDDDVEDIELSEPTRRPALRSPAPRITPKPELTEVRRTPRAPSEGTVDLDEPVAVRGKPEPRVATQARSIAAAAKRVLRDRYELLSVLARGSSSTVYKALDRHRANLVESARYVAIKLLNTSFENRAQALAELEREFHQAQSLSHPNIASVFDLDKDEGTYFIVMELLEGDLLANILRRLDNRPMARSHAFALINSIGSALAYAHTRQIAHGDLKPRNVMVTSDGEVRVLEFGFAHARALGSGDIDGAHEGVAIGTPAYASSERVHGFEPDPSDDVYSLACIAYELLSGRHPYGGRSALLARAHGKRPQRISWLNHRQWHALQRALVWDRADRKIEVADLLAALGTAEVKSDPVPPELLSIPDDTGGRRRRLFAMLAAVVLAVAFGMYMITRIPPPVQSIEATQGPLPRSGPATSQEPSATTEPATSPSAPATEEVTAPVVAQADAPTPSQQTSVAAPTNPSAARSGTIQFEKDTFVVTESDGSVSVQVRRTGSTRGVLSFRWTLRSNSAEAGADYAGIGPGLEQIPSGVSTATITIPLVSDAIVENTELFLVELEALDEGVTVGELGHAAVIIVDDD